MANPSLQIGNDNWAVKEDNLLGYSTAGTRFVPEPITMTRTSAGTRVNPSGLVEDVELLGGEEVTNGDFANWTGDNPDNFQVLNENAANYVTESSNQLRMVSDNSATIAIRPQPTSMLTVGKIYKVSVDLTFTTGSIDISGNSFNSSGTKVFYINAGATYLQIAKTSALDVLIDNVSIKEATIDNLARVDYTDGTSSLLVEPQRTNVNTYSEDFSQSFYIKDSGVSVGNTNYVSPSGESNATQIEVDNNNRIYANVTSDTYSSSVFIKAGTFAYFKFGGSNVDLEAGTYSGGTIESFGNGWFRITTAYTGNRPFQIQAYPDGTYSSHTTNGNYYIWGAQAEAGSYATSYIPTSGSTVTRNQETYTKTGISDLINSTEGVLFAELSALSNDGTNRGLSLSDGSSTNRILIYYTPTSNQIVGLYTYGGSTQVVITHTLSDSTEFIKCAFKFKENDCAFWINGVEVGTDTSSTAFSANTLNDLGFDSGAGASNFFGKVKQLQVFKTALSDDQIKQITS